jgi:flagellar biosynthesis/type III secretory pathway protein FliH
MGRVIRAQRTGPRVVPAEVFDAKREAARLLAEAQQQAEQLRADAQAQAALLRTAAVADGFSAGRAEATQQLFDVARLRSEALHKTEQQALRAVLLVAAELLGETLRADPAQIAVLLEPHLARMRRAEMIMLRVHPADASWLEQHRAALQLRAGLDCPIELHSDAQITRGGCVIESNLGELDARIETRLSELARALGLEEASA